MTSVRSQLEAALRLIIEGLDDDEYTHVANAIAETLTLSRWAAFTNDELRQFDEQLDGRLRDEVTTEIDKRNDPVA